MLQDRNLPDPDGHESRHVVVEAPPEAVFAAVGRANLLGSPRIRALHTLRRFLERTLGGRTLPDRDEADAKTLATDVGWVYLGAEPHEVLYAGIVRSEGFRDRIRAFRPETFAAFTEPGHVLATWDISVAPYGKTRSLLSSEMRWRATDDATRAKMRNLWPAARPVVGVLLDTTLDVVKEEAEK